MLQRVFAAIVAVGGLTGSALAKLGPGDAAPPLKISAWVKGAAVNPAADPSDTLYVVEFWATWCGPCKLTMPHLSELQKHFAAGKKVVVIGITDESADKVRTFLKTWDAKMQYAVACDEQRQTSAAYLGAAGAPGIPFAFLIRRGKVLWQGHPFAMDAAIGEHTGDKSWVEAVAKKREAAVKSNEIRDRFRDAANQRRWEDALKALDELVALDPSDPAPRIDRYVLLAARKRDFDAARNYGSQLVQDLTDPIWLDRLANAILREEAFAATRDLPLARGLAKKAARLTDFNNAEYLQTFALAAAMNNEFDTAVQMQARALDLSKDDKDPNRRAAMERELKRFESSKAVGVLVDAPIPTLDK